MCTQLGDGGCWSPQLHAGTHGPEAGYTEGVWGTQGGESDSIYQAEAWVGGM